MIATLAVAPAIVTVRFLSTGVSFTAPVQPASHLYEPVPSDVLGFVAYSTFDSFAIHEGGAVSLVRQGKLTPALAAWAVKA
jgi:hypothetical protein